MATVRVYKGPGDAGGLTPDYYQTLRMFKAWFGDVMRGHIDIGWTSPETGGIYQFRRFDCGDLETASEFAVTTNETAGQAVYWRPSAVITTAPLYVKDEHFLCAPGNWADLDDEEASKNAKNVTSMCRPTMAIITGRHPTTRVQLFWKHADLLTDPEQVRRINSAIRARVGGDPAVVNPTSLMRVAGTIAWPWKEGRIVELTQLVDQWPDNRPLAHPTEMVERSFPPVEEPRQERPHTVRDDAQEGGLHLDLGVKVDDYMAAIRAGKQWHNHLLGLLAHWISRGWSDAEILATAPSWTLAGYTVAQTVADMRKMIAGARAKWNIPDPEPKVDEPGASGQAPGDLVATPFEPLDIKAIPRREWVYGHHLIRGYISATVSPGGIGKSTMVMTDAIAIATGRDLVGDIPHVRGNAWHYNLEDPLDELQRRAVAICAKFGIAQADIAGRLFLNSGRTRRLVVATELRGAVVATPDAKALTEIIKANNIIAFSVDPFVRVHHVEENDNKQIDAVADIFAEIAHATGCAIDLVHHTRKLGNNDTATPGDMNAARGAGSLVAAVRAGRVLTEMSSNEAKTFGIQEDRRRWYIRVDDGKGNMRPPAANAKWLQRDSIDIGNGSIGPGDSVGVIAPWTPPDAWAGLSPTTAADILEEIDRGPSEGERYTAYKAGKRWAGQVIMKFCITKSEADAATIIKEWVKNGVLIETEYLSPGSRKTVGGLEIDRSKMPGNATESGGF